MQNSSMNEDPVITRILKRVRRIELVTRGLVRESLGGQYQSRFKGQGIEFDDFREYQVGDDVRSLDWNVTARMNTPFIRKYVEEREMTVLLMVDISASGDFGSHEDSKRERAAEIAAVFAFSALQNQDKVGLVLFSNRVEFYLPPAKGSAHALRVLREILYVQPEYSGTDVVPPLELALQRIAHRALVILISDFVQPHVEAHETLITKRLRAVSMKHDLVAVKLFDPVETELPNIGWINLEDPETGEQLRVNTASTQVRQQYKQRFIEQEQLWMEQMRRNQVETLRVSTDQEYLPVLQSYFRTRKRR